MTFLGFGHWGLTIRRHSRGTNKTP
jgi:hypothetical protein